MIRTTPIGAGDLPDVGRFLHENLNRKISPDAWAGSLSHRWAAEQPNHGMQLRAGVLHNMKARGERSCVY